MTLFVPQPFAEIVASEVEQVRTTTDLLTDFNVGSVVRTLLEANAVALDDYYQEMYLGLLRAIPTAVYTGFGFDLLPAVAAAGVVELTRATGETLTPLIVPAGTRLVSTSGAFYVTDAEATIPAEATSITVTATAEVVGAAGNTGPATITTSATAVTATNPALFAGGRDAETEEQRAERFVAYIRALSRGTLDAMTYAAGLPARYHPITGVLAERVQRAAVYETPGHVDLFIHNGSYGASPELLAAVQDLIDGYYDDQAAAWVGGYRPAGMRGDVQAMVNTPVDVSIELTAERGAVPATVAAEVSARLAVWLAAAVAGQAVRPISLINVALGVDGVHAATILAPTATLTVAADAVLYLRTLTVTWTA